MYLHLGHLMRTSIGDRFEDFTKPAIETLPEAGQLGRRAPHMPDVVRQKHCHVSQPRTFSPEFQGWRLESRGAFPKAVCDGMFRWVFLFRCLALPGYVQVYSVPELVTDSELRISTKLCYSVQSISTLSARVSRSVIRALAAFCLLDGRVIGMDHRAA